MAQGNYHYKHYLTACMLWASCAHPAFSLDIEGDVSQQDSSAYIIEDTSHKYAQYHLLPENAALNPYIGIGEDDVYANDHWDTYWRDHSYESAHAPERGNSWAGVKVKLSKMLKLDVDTNTHHVRSSVELSPKTKVKFRVKLKSIKATLSYRY